MENIYHENIHDNLLSLSSFADLHGKFNAAIFSRIVSEIMSKENSDGIFEAAHHELMSEFGLAVGVQFRKSLDHATRTVQVRKEDEIVNASLFSIPITIRALELSAGIGERLLSDAVGCIEQVLLQRKRNVLAAFLAKQQDPNLRNIYLFPKLHTMEKIVSLWPKKITTMTKLLYEMSRGYIGYPLNKQYSRAWIYGGGIDFQSIKENGEITLFVIGVTLHHEPNVLLCASASEFSFISSMRKALLQSFSCAVNEGIEMAIGRPRYLRECAEYVMAAPRQIQTQQEYPEGVLVKGAIEGIKAMTFDREMASDDLYRQDIGLNLWGVMRRNNARGLLKKINEASGEEDMNWLFSEYATKMPISVTHPDVADDLRLAGFPAGYAYSFAMPIYIHNKNSAEVPDEIDIWCRDLITRQMIEKTIIGPDSCIFLSCQLFTVSDLIGLDNKSMWEVASKLVGDFLLGYDHPLIQRGGRVKKEAVAEDPFVSVRYLVGVVFANKCPKVFNSQDDFDFVALCFSNWFRQEISEVILGVPAASIDVKLPVRLGIAKRDCLRWLAHERFKAEIFELKSCLKCRGGMLYAMLSMHGNAGAVEELRVTLLDERYDLLGGAMRKVESSECLDDLNDGIFEYLADLHIESKFISREVLPLEYDQDGKVIFKAPRDLKVRAVEYF